MFTVNKKCRKLCIEKLESREMIARASFWFVPSETEIEIGDKVAIEIFTKEHDPARCGLPLISLDVFWDDPEVLAAVNFDPQVAVTPRLPLFHGGTLSQENGEIKNLRGFSMLSGLGTMGGAIGNLYPERFATLEFVAMQEGETTFTMKQGGSRISTSPVASLHNYDFRFVPQTIIVSPNSYDVNRDGVVSSLDVLACVNEIQKNGTGPVGDDNSNLDVSKDQLISTLDVLLIVNQLNSPT